MAARAIDTHSDRNQDHVPNHITDGLLSMAEGGQDHGPNVYSPVDIITRLRCLNISTVMRIKNFTVHISVTVTVTVY